MKYEVKGMPSFMKDELKKKDEEKLEEMKREIDEAEAAEEEDAAEEAARDVREETAEGSREGTEEAENGADDPVKRAEKLEADLAEKDAQMLRLRADFDNFRRRSVKEREELAAVVTQGILTDMLPLLDNFERALLAEGSDLDSFRAGVSMIYKQMQEALVKNGLEVIDTKDKKFDPNFHQAVMRVQDPEKEDDTIEQELQKGYMVKGRVIRPSMVQVVSN
jgi:grpE